eukprot:scaffold1243_cov403-Prasinococcus_capsulatus_cf.AAC.33
MGAHVWALVEPGRAVRLGAVPWTTSKTEGGDQCVRKQNKTCGPVARPSDEGARPCWSRQQTRLFVVTLCCVECGGWAHHRKRR